MKPKIDALFDLSQTVAKTYLRRHSFPWEALPGLAEYILDLGPTLNKSIYTEQFPGIWVAHNAKIYKTSFIDAPAIIGERAELRHNAFLRGGVIVGNDAVIGNSCELKNCVIFNEAQIPHFNYVGDSIIGFRAHLGAGAITSNVKSDKTPVSVKTDKGAIDTGLKKFGAAVGDYCEVGCNSVLNPGTVLFKNSTVYPLSSVRGTVPENSIYKSADCIVPKE